jgi:hypothetical protein
MVHQCGRTVSYHLPGSRCGVPDFADTAGVPALVPEQVEDLAALPVQCVEAELAVETLQLVLVALRVGVEAQFAAA